MSDTPLVSRRRVVKAGIASLAIGTAARPAATQAALPARGRLGAPAGIITDLPATELSAAIARREVSCLEVMTAYLARIEQLNPTYNAIVALADGDALRQQARQADEELTRGQYRGWMHGMPHAVKDLADVSGFTNTGGSPLFRDYVSTQDAIFVERLRAAGAIFIGKTNVPEWGLGSQSYNPVYGVTGNAYNPSLTAGGSSGGAACGLATHMLPLADGSDMMGSLRNPAAYNNVIGFRPGQGRIPSDEGDLFFQQLACEGPMGRNVADVARLYQTMAGYDPRAPLSSREAPLGKTLAPRSLKDYRVGWLGDYDGYLAMEAGVMSLCEQTLQALQASGLRVEPCRPDFAPQRLWETWLTLRHWTICAGAKDLYDDERKRALLKPELIWEIEGGLTLDGQDIAGAIRDRSDWYRALRALFAEHDVLALPTAQVFPFDKQLHWPTSIDGRGMDTYHRWMEVVIGGTLSGCPVINLPAGFDADGRPMGMQFIAPLGHDAQLLEFALAYEAATDFLAQRPPGMT